MSSKSLKEAQRLLRGLPPLFQAMSLTLDNGCQCQVCVKIRNELIRMAKKHDAEAVLQKANADVTQ